jgi:hypothetical protein
LARVKFKKSPLAPIFAEKQGIWFEMSLDGGGMKDQLDGLGRSALVNLEPTR